MKHSSTALIYDNSRNVLMGKRRDTKKWSFIGGGQEANETPAQCISREALEEVGLNVLPESYTLLSTTKLPEVTLSVFELRTNRYWRDFLLTSTLDPDSEFEEIRFFSIDGVEELAKDNLLHIPALQNVAFAHLMENKNGMIGNLLGKIRNLFTVDTDDIQADSLSFKETRELQKELKGLFDELKNGSLGFKETRERQKRVKEIFALLKGGSEEKEIPIYEKIAFLRKYVGSSQIQALGTALRGEEKEFFKDKVNEIYNTIKSMPVTYEQDGKGDNAIAYLHYFSARSDWYITENDKEMPPHQAFGLVSLNGGEPELGYISITELIQRGAELDLYFKPKSLREIKGKADKAEDTKGTTYFDYDTAKLILSKSPDEITSHSLDWFYQDDRLSKLEKLIERGDEKAKEIEELAKSLNSSLDVNVDSILLDDIDNSQIVKLLGTAFLNLTPKGKVDNKKRDKAVEEIRKKIKVDNEFRKQFLEFVDNIGKSNDKR